MHKQGKVLVQRIGRDKAEWKGEWWRGRPWLLRVVEDS